MHISVRRTDPAPEIAAAILADLPAGLTMPRSTAHYLEAAGHAVTYLVTTGDGESVGILLLEPHFREAVEILVMAVRAGHLRQGIGRRLLAAVEGDAKAFGTRLIEVKVVGPSDPDPGSAASRAFYEDMGFLPVEEIHGLWQDKPALLMIKTL